MWYSRKNVSFVGCGIVRARRFEPGLEEAHDKRPIQQLHEIGRLLRRSVRALYCYVIPISGVAWAYELVDGVCGDPENPYKLEVVYICYNYFHPSADLRAVPMGQYEGVCVVPLRSEWSSQAEVGRLR